MKVYVVIDLFEGFIQDVKVFQSEANAAMDFEVQTGLSYELYCSGDLGDSSEWDDEVRVYEVTLKN